MGGLNRIQLLKKIPTFFRPTLDIPSTADGLHPAERPGYIKPRIFAKPRPGSVEPTKKPKIRKKEAAKDVNSDDSDDNDECKVLYAPPPLRHYVNKKQCSNVGNDEILRPREALGEKAAAPVQEEEENGQNEPLTYKEEVGKDHL